MQNMTFGQAVKTIFNKYAVFKGRARRAEYWWFTLFNLIVEMGLLFIMGLCSIPFLFKGGDGSGLSTVQNIFSVASCIWSLVVLLPACGVLTRRLHDVGISGWWVVVYYLLTLGVLVMALIVGISGDPESAGTGILIALGGTAVILSIFALVVFILTVIPGKKGDNKYGPDPKAEPETIDIAFNSTPESTEGTLLETNPEAPAKAPVETPAETPAEAPAPEKTPEANG